MGVLIGLSACIRGYLCYERPLRPTLLVYTPVLSINVERAFSKLRGVNRREENTLMKKTCLHVCLLQSDNRTFGAMTVIFVCDGMNDQ